MVPTLHIFAWMTVMATVVTRVQSHGQMTKPAPRPVTAKYRADCYGGLKGAGNDELQWAPVENLIERKQVDQPYAPTFDVMNGCRGMVYEAGGPVTELTAGQEFTVEYFIQAPHPGYLELAIVKPKTDSSGKIMYERSAVIKKVDNFATNSNGKSTTATIPTTLTGCNRAGDCALQFYWHSDIAKQTYPTCADIIVKGGAGGSGGAASGSSGSGGVVTGAGGSGTAPLPVSRSTSTNETPLLTPAAPALTSSRAPEPTKKSCVKRNRLRV